MLSIRTSIFWLIIFDSISSLAVLKLKLVLSEVHVGICVGVKSGCICCVARCCNMVFWFVITVEMLFDMMSSLL